jgi:xylose isomerase
MRVGIEYKPKEPRTHQIVPNAVKALRMSEDTGCENVGVIMDIGHSLIAKENPAEEAVYLMNKKRLFHLHSNDNYNDWDYDMLPASVHLWENLELFYWLDRLGYEGWINFDICPFREESFASCELSIRNTKRMVDYVQKLDVDLLSRSIGNNDAVASQQILWKALFD